MILLFFVIIWYIPKWTIYIYFLIQLCIGDNDAETENPPCNMVSADIGSNCQVITTTPSPPQARLLLIVNGRRDSMIHILDSYSLIPFKSLGYWGRPIKQKKYSRQAPLTAEQNTRYLQEKYHSYIPQARILFRDRQKVNLKRLKRKLQQELGYLK